MKYASTNSIKKLWAKIKSALSEKVDSTDERLSDSRTPKSHASSATTYGVSTATNYGHAKASSTTPKSNGTATAGSETGSFARGDHVHPTDETRASQETVQELQKTLEKLQADLTSTVEGIALDVLVGTNDLNIPLADSDGNELCGSDGDNLTGHFEIQFK